MLGWALYLTIALITGSLMEISDPDLALYIVGFSDFG